MYEDSRNKLDALSRLVTFSATKFRTKPSGEYLGHVANLLDRTMSQIDAQRMLEQMPRDFDIYPSIAQIEEYQKQFVRPKEVPQAHPINFWESTRAPGTPARLEAIFLMIENGHTNSGAFVSGLLYNNLTGEKAWEYHDSWARGEIHPEVMERIENGKQKKQGH